MRKAITAKDWGNEIIYRFKKYLAFLYGENDLTISCNSHGDLIIIRLTSSKDIKSDQRLLKEIKSAINMTTRDCPYEYKVIYE